MRKPNGLVPKFDQPGKRQITVIQEHFFIGKKEGTKIETDHQLNKSGDVVFAMIIAKDVARFSLQVCTSNSCFRLSENNSFLNIPIGCLCITKNEPRDIFNNFNSSESKRHCKHRKKAKG